jgi:hypothetical protein
MFAQLLLLMHPMSEMNCIPLRAHRLFQQPVNVKVIGILWPRCVRNLSNSANRKPFLQPYYGHRIAGDLPGRIR